MIANDNIFSGTAGVLTKKGKYALKAMVDLAQNPPGAYVSVPDIAERQNIPKKFLDVILGELRNAGFVASRMGKGGGYTLTRDPATISVGEIIRVIDGPLAPLPCASKTRYQRCDDCLSEESCAVRRVMQTVQQALSDVLDKCSLARMAQLGEQNARILFHEI